MNGKAQKTDSLERPSALDNKNLNSYYRIIEIIFVKYKHFKQALLFSR